MELWADELGAIGLPSCTLVELLLADQRETEHSFRQMISSTV